MQLRFAHFQVAMGAIISLTTTGVVYGWTGLREIFDDDLTYSELCGENELSCSARDMKLSTVYSVGSAGIYVSMLFLGTLLDRMGPKITATLGCFLSMCGSILMAISDSRTRDYFLPALLLYGFGGPGIHLSLMHFSNKFLPIKSTIIALFSGMFTSSSVVFAVFTQVYMRSTLTRYEIFLGYACLQFVWLLTLLAIEPMKQIVPGASLTGTQVEQQSLTSGMMSSEHSLRPLTLKEQTFKNQIKSPEFWYLATFFSVHVMRTSVYVGTINDQMKFLVGTKHYDPLATDIPALVNSYVDIFSWLMPCGCLLVPFVGRLLDRRGTPATFAVCNSLNLLYGVLSCLPLLETQYFTFISYTVARPFVFGSFYATIGLTFGFKSYGKLCGVGAIVSAFPTFLQIPLVMLADEAFGGSYVVVNVIQTAALVPLFHYPFFLKKSLERQALLQTAF